MIRNTWMEQAACQSADPEVFFPAKGAPAHPAKRICGRCPVTAECFEYMANGPEDLAPTGIDGVWGNTTPNERRAAAGLVVKRKVLKKARPS